jgi:hypothetical protein
MENSSNTTTTNTSEITQISDCSTLADKSAGQHYSLQRISPSEDDGLVELMELLEDIDENKAAAKLNEVSMMDNMGRRIYY